ncbi:MAG: UDP-N-acetylmuramate dehydrogenase [Ilumatobacter sp.]|nr:UDP-N-acetylmuramate dehydrogenase [Ilumatobacter sp.]
MPVAPTDHLAAVDVAVAVLGDRAERNVPIGPLTTYRVGGAADIFVRVRTHDDLDALADALRASGLPMLPIGRGSNLLVADAGFRGIAVSTAALGGATAIDIDEQDCCVVAGAAVLLPVLARRTAAAGLTGFEWAVGVPGSVGGAVRMNAGGHGSDMAAVVVSATIADVSGAEPADTGRRGAAIRTVPAAALGLRFRGSDLGPGQLVLDVTLQLAAGDRTTAEQEISEIVHWRRANQPGGQNAGSVFVNPVPGEVTCGALIDGAGLRGLRHGTATVSEKHANFIQADEDGSADDVRELMRIVRSEVERATGYRLRSEIRLIGFDEDR